MNEHEQHPSAQPARPYGVRCRMCNYLVTFADVYALSQVRPGVYFIAWQCECGDREQHGRMAPSVVDALLGPFHPRLPYSAAPLQTVPLDEGAEELLAEDAALLETVHNVPDFLTLCEHK